jgi:RHH-type proline utilization regulon transcriptional repressor/proline dehydrogenase/delta 1-pyrroline-5-carboxylate dehydrogenase
MRISTTRAGRAALGRAAAAGVRHMAHRFIVGESVPDAAGTLRRLWDDGIASSVDLLGEATVTPAEAERYAQRCADALRHLAATYAPLDPNPLLERDSLGPLPRADPGGPRQRRGQRHRRRAPAAGAQRHRSRTAARLSHGRG